jgi:hypothetical protein
MTSRVTGIACLGALMLILAGCGGVSSEDCDGNGACAAPADACTVATAKLKSTVSNGNRASVNRRLDIAAEACAEELDYSGSEGACNAARASLAEAASRKRTPDDLDAIVSVAVMACVDTT